MSDAARDTQSPAPGVSREPIFNPTPRVPWLRKAWHVACGLYFMAIAAYLPHPWPLLHALAWLCIWLFVEVHRRRNREFHAQFMAVAQPMMRRSERIRLLGNVWFCLGLIVAMLIDHSRMVAVASLIGFTFGDPAAEIFGRAVATPRFTNRKTVGGACACFAVSWLAYYGYFHLVGVAHDWQLALVGATATTLAESGSNIINDNCTIPLFSALALSHFL